MLSDFLIRNSKDVGDKTNWRSYLSGFTEFCPFETYGDANVKQSVLQVNGKSLSWSQRTIVRGGMTQEQYIFLIHRIGREAFKIYKNGLMLLAENPENDHSIKLAAFNLNVSLTKKYARDNNLSFFPPSCIEELDPIKNQTYQMLYHSVLRRLYELKSSFELFEDQPDKSEELLNSFAVLNGIDKMLHCIRLKYWQGVGEWLFNIGYLSGAMTIENKYIPIDRPHTAPATNRRTHLKELVTKKLVEMHGESGLKKKTFAFLDSTLKEINIYCHSIGKKPYSADSGKDTLYKLLLNAHK